MSRWIPGLQGSPIMGGDFGPSGPLVWSPLDTPLCDSPLDSKPPKPTIDCRFTP